MHNLTYTLCPMAGLKHVTTRSVANVVTILFPYKPQIASYFFKLKFACLNDLYHIKINNIQ